MLAELANERAPCGAADPFDIAPLQKLERAKRDVGIDEFITQTTSPDGFF
jgi:hypothetical protein